MDPAHVLSTSVIAAVSSQAALITSIRTLFAETNTLAVNCRSKRQSHHKLGTNEHPHGAKYYSARTLRNELNHVQKKLNEQRIALKELNSQCDDEVETKDVLVKEIVKKATDISISLPATYLSSSSQFQSSGSGSQSDSFFNSSNLNRHHINGSLPIPHPNIPPKLSNQSFNFSRTSLLCYRKHLKQQERLQKLQKEAAQRIKKANMQTEDELWRNAMNRADNDKANALLHKKSEMSWETINNNIEEQKINDLQGLYTLQFTKNKIAQQLKKDLMNQSVGKRRARRRKSTMLRGVASSSVKPEPSPVGQRRDTGELSVDAGWLTGKNRELSVTHSLYHQDSLDSNVSSKSDVDGAGAIHEMRPQRPTETGAGDGAPTKIVPTEWLRMVFDRMDKDGGGTIDRNEFIEGFRSDPDIAQLFDMNIGDESTSTFKDIFDCIDDDGSKEISFDEFAAFFDQRKEGFFHASDQVEAMYEPEGIWYVAKIVKGVKTATAANTEKGPAFDSYMIRYTEYPDEGPFRVSIQEVRARFKKNDVVLVLLGEHSFIEKGKLANIISSTNNGYVIKCKPPEEDKPGDFFDYTTEHTVFASDVFPVNQTYNQEHHDQLNVHQEKQKQQKLYFHQEEKNKIALVKKQKHKEKLVSKRKMLFRKESLKMHDEEQEKQKPKPILQNSSFFDGNIQKIPKPHEGWLYKSNGKGFNYKKRYFVLSKNQFCYRNKKKDGASTRCFLKFATLYPLPENFPSKAKTQFKFRVQIQQKKKKKDTTKMFYLCADTQEELDVWLLKFQEHIAYADITKGNNDLDDDESDRRIYSRKETGDFRGMMREITENKRKSINTVKREDIENKEYHRTFASARRITANDLVMTEKTKARFENDFLAIDIDRDGSITKNEYMKYIRQQPDARSEKWITEAWKSLLSVDDGDGCIQLEEYIQFRQYEEMFNKYKDSEENDLQEADGEEDKDNEETSSSSPLEPSPHDDKEEDEGNESEHTDDGDEGSEPTTTYPGKYGRRASMNGPPLPPPDVHSGAIHPDDIDDSEWSTDDGDEKGSPPAFIRMSTDFDLEDKYANMTLEQMKAAAVAGGRRRSVKE